MTSTATSKPDILMIDPMPDDITQRLADHFTLHRYRGMDALGPVASSIRGVTTGGGAGLKPEIMAALPHLEIISVNGVGTDQIDLVEAKRRGIRVATTQGVLDDDVADMAIGLMIDVMRGISANDRFVRAGHWGKLPVPNSHALTGKKVGIVGFGQIGSIIAERADALRMAVAYYARHRKDGVSYPYFDSIVALADHVDVLILAVPGTPETRNMVNRAVIDALGPNGYLINIARGSVVDEPELVAALTEKRIAGAGLDVFVDEPHVPEALLALDNVVLQAHRGTSTVEVRTAMGHLVIDNLLAQFAGKPLLTPVI
ncbi:2-hydroxyacid dehydrogenase [Brytella acorum]|uniref:2-hydroxyacid dehydrogenase n=1 Tax=Brytella acorum TaxID=2959299 RepID=A0AA35UVF5_9PROT|nr:2-hydroxyacid dehydrogenase [Brytella acorum]MDF3624846.1 2-hydroxyacid dehydrogenase [Brytella acorum]CAI9120149.1 2-hydroxyacid dehydrogenase [Brytella acorum]